jgi:hypothetical protein
MITCPHCHHRYDVTVTLHTRGSATFSTPEAADSYEVGPQDNEISASGASTSTLPPTIFTPANDELTRSILSYGKLIRDMYTSAGECKFCVTRELVGVPPDMASHDMCFCDVFGQDDIDRAFATTYSDEYVPETQGI